MDITRTSSPCIRHFMADQSKPLQGSPSPPSPLKGKASRLALASTAVPPELPPSEVGVAWERTDLHPAFFRSEMTWSAASGMTCISCRVMREASLAFAATNARALGPQRVTLMVTRKAVLPLLPASARCENFTSSTGR